MAGIIFKWRYLKAGASGRHSENLIRYIAQREGVEKLDDSWKHRPVTKAQTELITQILSDYPDAKDSFEYQDYEKSRTAGAASEFITRAIEERVDLIGKRENYVEYIAKRPRVERQGSHGLFTDDGVPINLSAAAKEVANHKGVVFTEILSLRREDAVRLGYDKGSAWRDLLRSQTDAMAAAMKIPLTDLRWYAAFHNESHHPHVHIVAYSAGREPYMTEQGLHKLKSVFARQIFKQDLLQVYTEQTKQRNTLTQKSRDVLADIIGRINSGSCDNPIVADLLVKLSEQLKHCKGKKVYGYLPQAGRNIVNAVVDELAKDKNIAALYDLWYEQRDTLYLFEAPIDMLSFISMQKEGWRQHSYAASCSVSDRVLFQMLKDNPNIRQVVLCLDSDEPGQTAAKRIADKLFVQGTASEILVPVHKDWNEDLLTAVSLSISKEQEVQPEWGIQLS